MSREPTDDISDDAAIYNEHDGEHGYGGDPQARQRQQSEPQMLSGRCNSFVPEDLIHTSKTKKLKALLHHGKEVIDAWKQPTTEEERLNRDARRQARAAKYAEYGG